MAHHPINSVHTFMTVSRETINLHTCLLLTYASHVCLVNRNPLRPCRHQRQEPSRSTLLPFLKTSQENPRKRRPLPPSPCCVCSKRPSTGKLRGCSSSSSGSSFSLQSRRHPSGGSSSRSSSRLTTHRPSPPSSPHNPCTRLWI